MNVNRRLDRLQWAFGGNDHDESSDPFSQKLARRQRAIYASMAPEHRKHVEEIDRRYKEALDSGEAVLDAVRLAHSSKLFLAVWDLMDGDGPAQMPPHVARIYLEDESASALHDCERCGYKVPIRPGDYRTPAVRYFERCPLDGCNGETGWYAFYQSHGHHPPDPVT
jgi:hypothetical protein